MCIRDRICIEDQNDSIIALMLLYLSTHDFTGSRVHFDQMVELSNHVAFQTANDVPFTLAFGGSAGDVINGGLVESHSHDHGPIDRGIELPVSSICLLYTSRCV